MFYLKINAQIRNYINQISNVHFGCQPYCPLQIIALDEFELLRKKLKEISIELTDEEYKKLIKDTEVMYYSHVHTCDIPKEEREKQQKLREEQIISEFHKEKIPKKTPNAFIDFDKIDINYKLRKKQEEQDEKLFKKNSSLDRGGNKLMSITNGFSMIFSFFLLVGGAYYLGKYFFGLNDSNTYKLMLVVTIVVFISEACLLLLKLHREDMRLYNDSPNRKKMFENSFAYKFNKSYRRNIDQMYNLKSKEKKD